MLPKKGLNIGHQNIQGLNNSEKLSEISLMLSSRSNIDVFGISETKFSEKVLNNSLKMGGYKFFRKDNMLRNGGGLLIYVKDSVNVKRRIDLERNDVECIVLEIIFKCSKPILTCHIYRHPSCRVEWKDNFEELVDKMYSEDKEIIIMGDINRDLMNMSINKDWSEFISSIGLEQLVNQPTRITKNSKTLIDHVYSSMPETIVRVSVPHIGNSDHFPVFITRKICKKHKSRTHEFINFRNFRNFNESQFCHELSNIDWSELFVCESVDDCLEVWQTKFLAIVDAHMPLQTKRVKRKYQPAWFTSDIADAIKMRDIFSSDKKSHEYKSKRNLVLRLIRESRKSTYEKRIEDGQNNPKTIWGIFKEFGSSKNNSEMSRSTNLSVNDKLITDEIEVANAFNNFFVTVAQKLKDPIATSNFEYLIEYVNTKVPPENYFSIPLIAQHNVLKHLKRLNVSKSTGLDHIGPRLLKISAPYISEPLTTLINMSILQASFPNTWKTAKVKPLFKKGDETLVDNYRPISILPTLSKLIEKHVHDAMISHLNNFNLLHNTQSGFRRNHSTESALLHLRENWLNAVNDGKMVGTLLVDFKKAFDLVDHDVLMKKLKIYKFDRPCVEWVKSYLTNRHQYVQINNSLSSDKETITCGVQQGSILGPLLFLLFINDLPLVIGNTVHSTDLYADDTTIYDIQYNKEIIESNLNSALSSLDKWCITNGMQINTDKTKVMLITTNQKRHRLENVTLQIFYRNSIICQSSCEKILGVFFQDSFKSDSHIKFVSKKVSSFLWLLSRIKEFLPQRYRVLFYKAYIQPHLDYCSLLWGSTTVRNIKKIVKLQKRACKIILGKDYVDFETSLHVINAEEFKYRIEFNKSIFMYKVNSNDVPKYICDMFKRQHSEHNNFNLRSSDKTNFCIPMPHTEIFKHGMLYSGSILWNNLPIALKSAPSLSVFKLQYKNEIKSQLSFRD